MQGFNVLHTAQKLLLSPVPGTYIPHAVFIIPSYPLASHTPTPVLLAAPLDVPFLPIPNHPLAAHLLLCKDLPRMEPELFLTALLKAITALTATIGSLQDHIGLQGQQLIELKAICKETTDLVGNKDQGPPQAKPGPLTGPITPPTHLGGKPTLQAWLGLDSRPCSTLQKGQGLTQKKKNQGGLPKGALPHALEP
ncbi:hypothetical protein RHS01_10429 [Rhizoctonia solani]|uniref:Uncharacterized protein n=1 Tax=Rhizoctonia solani TaxID=456999 RepID=A0A8H7I4V9_9AGAM|nr:hypothetical protein RHS01_10429 [Rhizoctonia solani]